jgi:hypothetical protein
VTRPYYRATVTVGPKTWAVASTDTAAPTSGPLLPLTFGWAVPDQTLGFPAQPDPAAASLSILAAVPADVAGIEIGSPVAVSVWLHNPADPPPTDPAATGVIASFAGRVADIKARPHWSRGTVYQITAIDYTVDLAARLVGATAYPSETGEARADRILADAGATPPAGLAPDPGGTFAARAAAPTPARDLLLETMSHGVTADKARWIITSAVNDETGAPAATPYTFRPVRRAVYAIDSIDPCVIDGGAEWSRNRRTAADWVTIDHPGGPTIYGPTTGVPLPPVKTDRTDPADLAAFLLDNIGGVQLWDAGTLRLHLHAPDAAAYRGPVAGWFDYGLGRAVEVPGLPAPQSPGGVTRFSGMLAGARFTIPADGRYYVDFKVRADVPNDSYQVTRWSDIAGTVTWANMSQTDTWAQYEPGTATGGAGTLTVRWSDMTDTWDTIDPAMTWFAYRTIPHP